MTDRLQPLDAAAVERIRGAALRILDTTGVAFHDEVSLDLFRHHGFRVDGRTVRFTAAQVEQALASTPARFTLRARNPERAVAVGGDDVVLLPTGGVTHIALPDGRQRRSTMADFETCCKLVHTSPCLDIVTSLMADPSDLPGRTAYLDTLQAILTLCDRPIMGSSQSRQNILDSIEMAAIVHGGRGGMAERPLLGTIVNPLSPLQYSSEQSAVIYEMARLRQPVMITNMVMAGSSGPVSLPGVLVLQAAEILAGLVLAQTAGPGAPVGYGSTSCAMDMRTGCGAVGTPETTLLAAATVQLAEHFGLPCRAGGALTDAHLADGQAMAEGVLNLSTALRSGAHVILHSCGQMGSYISLSFEKWLLDEEVGTLLQTVLRPLEVTPETLAVDVIEAVGVGGEYLTHSSTFEGFRRLAQPRLFNRRDHTQWTAAGARDVRQLATEALETRLAGYVRPLMDPAVEEELQRFVVRRKAALDGER